MVLAIVVAITFFSALASANHSFAQPPLCNGQEATIVGSEKGEKIRGTSGNDVIVGLGGNDRIYGRGGNDIICGGEGNDKIHGNSGNDVLIGGLGADKIYGGHGVDTCDVMGDDRRAKQCEIQYEKKVVDDSSAGEMQEQLKELQNKLDELTKQFTELFGLWENIEDIPEDLKDGDDDTLQQLECTHGQLVQMNNEGWECIDAPSSSSESNPPAPAGSNPIFFHFSNIEGGITEWVGVSSKVNSLADSDKPALVMPASGKISNLFAQTGKSGDMPNPGQGQSYTLTIIKNDSEETALTCSISDLETSCSNIDSEISINSGDTIVLRVDASSGANSAIIRSSIQFS